MAKKDNRCLREPQATMKAEALEGNAFQLFIILLYKII